MLWCRPKLTRQLRQDINGLAETIRVKIDEAIQEFRQGDAHGKQVHFVEISHMFDGHRFCEANHNVDDQWEDDPKSQNVWLYNPPRPPWVPQEPMQKDIDAWRADHPDEPIGADSDPTPDRPGSYVPSCSREVFSNVYANYLQGYAAFSSEDIRVWEDDGSYICEDGDTRLSLYTNISLDFVVFGLLLYPIVIAYEFLDFFCSA